MKELKTTKFDVRKIVKPKWYYMFNPFRWPHFFIYKKKIINRKRIIEMLIPYGKNNQLDK
jgi:hypothetical protein